MSRNQPATNDPCPDFRPFHPRNLGLILTRLSASAKYEIQRCGRSFRCNASGSNAWYEIGFAHGFLSKSLPRLEQQFSGEVEGEMGVEIRGAKDVAPSRLGDLFLPNVVSRWS